MPQPGVGPAEQSGGGGLQSYHGGSLGVTLECSRTEVWTHQLHSFPRNEARNRHIQTQELHIPGLSAEYVSGQKQPGLL